MDEVELIAAAQRGDVNAFKQLYDAHMQPLIEYAKAILKPAGQADDAEDVAMEALARAFQHISSFRAECRFWHWLKSIARNVCFSRLSSNTRRLGREREWVANLLTQTEYTNGALAMMTTEENLQLRHLVEQLPPHGRDVIKKLFLDQCPDSEVARSLGITVNQANGRKYRAIDRLRKWMRGD